MSQTTLELNSETALDFAYEPPCEHRQHTTEPDFHSGPAYVLVRTVCNNCNDDVLMYLCKRYWEAVLGDFMFVRCECGQLGPAYKAYIFIAYVNSKT